MGNKLLITLLSSKDRQNGKIRKGLLHTFGVMFLVTSFGFLLAGGQHSIGARMTAVSGGTTFTTSEPITINAGDYIIPSITTEQARMVTTTSTGKTFTVSPPFSTGITTQPFTVHHAITGPEQAGKQVIIFPTRTDKSNNLQLQTFTVKACKPTVVNFLIDVSGSMADTPKVKKQTKEKAALRAFTARMADNFGIGIQTFSNKVQEKVPLKLYKDAKAQVKTTIDKLPATGNTHTRDALKFTQTKLSDSIAKKQFPGYKYALVLLTDGVPEDELEHNSQNCIAITTQDDGSGVRCFAKSQDPRKTLTDSINIGQQIKNLGVEVYSIGMTSKESPSDKFMKPYLDAMLTDVASKPSNAHYYSSLNGDNLSVVMDRVFNDICDEQTETKTVPAT